MEFVIEPVPMDDVDPELRSLIEEGRASGMLSISEPTQIFAYAPELAKANVRQYRAIFGGPLEPRLRELVRQKIASFNDCRPCLASRKSDDVADDDLACLDASNERFTSRERAALRYAELFATDHLSIGPADYEELLRHFTLPEIIELGISCGYYLGTGRFVHTLTATSDEDANRIPYRPSAVAPDIA